MLSDKSDFSMHQLKVIRSTESHLLIVKWAKQNPTAWFHRPKNNFKISVLEHEESCA